MEKFLGQEPFKTVVRKVAHLSIISRYSSLCWPLSHLHSLPNLTTEGQEGKNLVPPNIEKCPCKDHLTTSEHAAPALVTCQPRCTDGRKVFPGWFAKWWFDSNIVKTLTCTLAKVSRWLDDEALQDRTEPSTGDQATTPENVPMIERKKKNCKIESSKQGKWSPPDCQSQDIRAAPPPCLYFGCPRTWCGKHKVILFMKLKWWIMMMWEVTIEAI